MAFQYRSEIAAILLAAALSTGASCEGGRVSILAPLNRQAPQTAEETAFVRAMLQQENGEVAARAYLKAKGYSEQDCDRIILAAKTCSACGK